MNQIGEDYYGSENFLLDPVCWSVFLVSGCGRGGGMITMRSCEFPKD